MPSLKRLAPALAMTLAVCLTACSDLLTDLDKTSLAIQPKEVAAVAVKSEPLHPDIPANLVACATAAQKPPPAKDGKTASADAKVNALKYTAEERRKCALAILGWYRKIQEANKKAETGKKAGPV